MRRYWRWSPTSSSTWIRYLRRLKRLIYTECETEEELALLFHSPRDVTHCTGKAKVLKTLEKKESSIGLIDEDPERPQPPSMSRYETVRPEREDIRVLSDQHKGNRLIVLCPRMEEWVLKAAEESRIKLNRYGLPNEPDRFKKEIGLRTDKFRRLIKDLLERRNRRLEALGGYLR